MADGVLMWRIAGNLHKEPAVGVVAQEPLDVQRQLLEKGVGEKHHAFAAVLRSPDLHQAVSGSLYLTSHAKASMQEVDVTDPYGGRLAETEAREGGEREQRLESLVGCFQDGANLVRCRDGQPVLGFADTGEGQSLAGVECDDAIAYGCAQHGADVVGTGSDRAGLEAGIAHDLDPLFEVRAPQLAHRYVAEGDGTSGQVHGPFRRRLPHLPRSPVAVEGRERDPSGLGIDVLPERDSGGDFIEPALGVLPPAEVSSMLAALLVAVAGTPTSVRTSRNARHGLLPAPPSIAAHVGVGTRRIPRSVDSANGTDQKLNQMHHYRV